MSKNKPKFFFYFLPKKKGFNIILFKKPYRARTQVTYNKLFSRQRDAYTVGYR